VSEPTGTLAPGPQAPAKPSPASAGVVLHVGCGRAPLPAELAERGWREIRYDIDPAVEPDLVGSITAMDRIADGSIDAIRWSHNLEHFADPEVPRALAEFLRVLRPGGVAWIALADVQSPAERIASGELDAPPITPPPSSETPLRLEHGSFCYAPIPGSPPVTALPCEALGVLTFSCLNQAMKLNGLLFACWAEILRAMPGSRLWLQNSSLDQPATRERREQAFAGQGEARLRKRVNWGSNSSFTVPTGPLRCLVTITSVIPRSAVSGL